MHVIITGGSSGIGLALARRYLERDTAVTVVGRSKSRLEAAQQELLALNEGFGPRLMAVEADVNNEPALRDATAKAEAALGPCDILITSAGLVEPAAFDVLDGSRFSAQVETNLIGTANAIRCVYAGMKERGKGRILMISSGAALIGIHGYTAYCASKSALVGFSEALRVESAPYGVKVSICYPPDTETPQFANELPLRSPQAIAVMGTVRPWTAGRVAERIEQLLSRGADVIHFGPGLTLLARFGPLVKPMLYWWFRRRTRHIV
ncbi:SDR family oxidoreductase [Ciceribacter sp. L1K23]|uniref:SDR family oxidoreductase n=1 Tax=Ciceribacter sp. L1K23 TaxID=2820276 RepID=UPI001B812D2C|nr:SDR family oxidoreductase [Ciceribacter sp. L1K23]MBR0554124.1 SDR family oxidoreductase [Ciceribacter sp. L1K23]